MDVPPTFIQVYVFIKINVSTNLCIKLFVVVHTCILVIEIVELEKLSLNLKLRRFRTLFSSIPIVTCGWSRNGSYAQLQKTAPWACRGLSSLETLMLYFVVGPSFLGSPHGCCPLKTVVLSTGYDALPSALKGEARLHTVGVATKK